MHIYLNWLKITIEGNYITFHKVDILNIVNHTNIFRMEVGGQYRISNYEFEIPEYQIYVFTKWNIGLWGDSIEN